MSFNPFFQPPGGATGDTFPFYKDGVWHLFHMQPPLIAHHTSRDLISWQEHPVVVRPGPAGAPDSDNCATGTVVEHDGKFYCFYTGNQNVCLATSDDLENWTKHPNNPVLQTDGVIYRKENFRDPFVFWNREEKLWWLLIATQHASALPQRGGCIGLAKSRDLIQWRFAAPLDAPGNGFDMETPQLIAPLWAPQIGPHADCPQLLEHQKRWYLLYLQRQTRYRIADKISGPFRRPPVPDIVTPYANAGSRPAFDGKRWISWPFVTRLKDDNDFGDWVYGGALGIARQWDFQADGQITERPADEIVAAVRALPAAGAPLAATQTLAGHWDTNGVTARCTSAGGGTLMLAPAGANLYFEADVILPTRNMDAHLILRAAPDLLTGYKISLHPAENQVRLRPISLWDTDSIIAARPVELPLNQPIKLRAFVSGSLCEVFIADRISLSARFYSHHSEGVALEFRDAPGVFQNILIRPLQAGISP